jgi:Mg2+/citrate symporter
MPMAGQMPCQAILAHALVFRLMVMARLSSSGTVLRFQSVVVETHQLLRRLILLHQQAAHAAVGVEVMECVLTASAALSLVGAVPHLITALALLPHRLPLLHRPSLLQACAVVAVGITEPIVPMSGAMEANQTAMCALEPGLESEEEDHLAELVATAIEVTECVPMVNAAPSMDGVEHPLLTVDKHGGYQ